MAAIAPRLAPAEVSREIPIVGAFPKINRLLKIPQALFHQIFSCLNKEDLHNTTLLNREMKNKVIIACNDFMNKRRFIRLLIENLDIKECHEQINLMTLVLNNIKPETYVNLKLLKISILELKEELIETIKTLDFRIIRDLELRIHPPYFMEDIFNLSKVEREIYEVTETVPESPSRDKVLATAYPVFIKAGKMDRAIEVVNKMIKSSERDSFLYNISKVLTKIGKIERAIKVARMIQGYELDSALGDISEVLIQTATLKEQLKFLG